MIDIPPYLDYLPAPLLGALRRYHEPVHGVPGLTVDPALLEGFDDVHGPAALGVVCRVYDDVKEELRAVLEQRVVDRQFLDDAGAAIVAENEGVDYLSGAYRTVIGLRDSSGRVVVGPGPSAATAGPGGAVRPVVLPPHLQPPAVTLFGPPDNAKMCINAMNALHRRRPDEPPVVGDLVDGSGVVPMWGADSEDSKTPFMADLLAATRNLRRCWDRDLEHTDRRTGKHYALAADRLSVPIKRIPGIALPDGTHLYRGNPLPLHLVDLVLHLVLHHDRPEALAFYVPKLESEEEAAYVAALVRSAEARVAELHPGFPEGAVRLFVVFETPRAIFRIREIADALHPYFAGGSLGWHDFLGFTARMFKYDRNYRIPVKADPNIVVHHIKESHVRLAEALDPIGAVKIGGMYGTLFEDGDAASFQVSMVGFVRDVISQLRRGLDGFWVAHPDFVRIGIALVEAWRREAADPGSSAVDDLVRALVPDPAELEPLLRFLAAPDVEGHAPTDPLYPRRVLAADIVESEVVANSHPDEVRYNVFQAVQYLAAWLSGTGCVALPATLHSAGGDAVFVRVMDDLATTERSRWELWAEVNHGRVPRALFEEILAEELAFVEEGRSTATKRVQVRWTGQPARWYPVAAALLHQLVTDPSPVEAVTELLLPFTLDVVRGAGDPWRAARELCPGRYTGSPSRWAPDDAD